MIHHIPGIGPSTAYVMSFDGYSSCRSFLTIRMGISSGLIGHDQGYSNVLPAMSVEAQGHSMKADSYYIHTALIKDPSELHPMAANWDRYYRWYDIITQSVILRQKYAPIGNHSHPFPSSKSIVIAA